MNYAKELPQDRKDQRFDGAPPAFPSLQSQNGVPVVSSVISLTDKTTVIELSAIGGQAGNGGIIFKWGSASVSGTNYDGIIQSGVTRVYVVPQSVMGTSSVAGANVANGLYAAIAVKTATAQSASVFSVEY